VTQSIKDKIVAIAGVSRGLGEATARRLAQPEDVDINEILFRPTRQEF
jgi:NAD(P)-dependent dehydrogenase (short-subunit alcohol dehydrogenase family)